MIISRQKKNCDYDVDALVDEIRQVQADSDAGKVPFRLHSEWKGQTLCETKIQTHKRGEPRIRLATIGGPRGAFGSDSPPNPQEMLLASLNSCMIVGYAAGAAMRGVEIESLEIDSSGEFDLRGVLGIDPTVRPCCQAIKYVVHIKGDGSDAQFSEIHDMVMRTSPHYFNVAQPIRLDATLIVKR